MRVLLTGASGGLGAFVLETLLARGVEVVGWSGRKAETRFGVSLSPIDLGDQAALIERLDAANADAVLHLAAIASAEEARRNPTRARRINIHATEKIAQWCSRHDRKLIFTSTDMVFDGARAWNAEEDLAAPILEYARTKLKAEEHVRKCSRGLVARVALLYGFTKSGRPTFFDRAFNDLKQGKPRAFFEDEFRTPLSFEAAAGILADLIEIDASGTLHVGGRERLSRFDLMRRAAGALGLDAGLVQANRRDEVGSIEPRPADLSLDTTKLAKLLPEAPRRNIEESLSAGSFSRAEGSLQ